MINKVILIGNIGVEPEVRTLESGVKVARLRLATTERIKKGEEWIEHTEWHTVVAWRVLADRADKFIKKGSQIYVEGTLRRTEWKDKDGVERSDVQIVATDLRMLGRRETSQTDAVPTATPATTPATTPKPNLPSMPDKDIDDLPF